MSRKNTFENKSKLVEALAAVKAGTKAVSRFLALQLVDLGFLAIEVQHKPSVGRPSHRYVLTGKARGYMALAANWGRKTENLWIRVKMA